MLCVEDIEARSSSGARRSKSGDKQAVWRTSFLREWADYATVNCAHR